MRALPLMLAGALLGCGVAAAADSPPDNPDTVHVKSIRDPKVQRYKAIVAGLDEFDRYHRLAPAADALRFRVEPRNSAPADAKLLVRLEGDNGFVLPLTLDAGNKVLVPRSEAALDANSELTLNQKRRDYRIRPQVRTQGLADNVQRLGDLRLECKVKVAIAKEEIGLMTTLFINSILLTTDWCSFNKFEMKGFSFGAPQVVTAAFMHEGHRSRNIEFHEKSFMAPLFDTSWGDDALIELTFAPQSDLTGTAGETPRTAP